MSIMVLFCWTTTGATPIIYMLKFAELAALNMWAISSIAIALLIARMVKVRYVALMVHLVHLSMII